MTTKRTLIGALTLCSLLLCGTGATAQELTIEAPAADNATKGQVFHLGTAVRPDGRTLYCDSKSLIFDGKPTVAVMGEFHFTRYNENEWRRELLKMKAGGVTVVATYLFWIHHEEEKGIFDWSGQRNVRRFVEICKELDLPVILRMGPFAHGECRNGGLPEWVVDGSYKYRTTDPAFLELARLWYANVYNQVKGLLWKDGGTIIGIQLDNEYRGPWEYLKALKDLAVEIGFDVPIYTRTGWPELTTPAEFGQIIPLYGDYPDGFWDRSLDEMPGDCPNVYLFRPSRISSVIASEQFAKDEQKKVESMAYPYFTCELGGGMASSYHRRINIEPKDIHALCIAKIGSGSNLPGYYMYHSGTNPEGLHSTMNEQQASVYMNHNDLPCVSYEYQSPLAEFGQTNEQYHWLRRTHQFLADFGEELAGMDPTFPKDNVTDARGKDRLRWSVRSNGRSGYVFVNNYQRLRQLSTKKGVRFKLHLPGEDLTFPKKAISVPSGASFFLPFNLKAGCATIKYATAQPFATITDRGVKTLFFAAIDQLTASMLIATDGEVTSDQSFTKSREGYLFGDLQAGTDCVINITGADGQTTRIVVLDEKLSLQSYKVKTGGREYLFITESGLSSCGDELYLEQWNSEDFSGMVYPRLTLADHGLKVQTEQAGLFTRYHVRKALAKTNIPVAKQLRLEKDFSRIQIGPRNVAQQPADSVFAHASVWRIEGFEKASDVRNLFLRIDYEGDVARVYAGDKLVEDNFYNGKPMYVPLSWLAGSEATLKILPLHADYPIYTPQAIRERLQSEKTLLGVKSLSVEERLLVTLKMEE